MEITTTTFAANRTEWRDWLKQHHATDTEVWLVYYKKGSGKPTARQSRLQRGSPSSSTGRDSPGSRVVVPVLARDTGHGVTYLESLEEALCFGWIDSLIQKIDDEKYARKFNPRRVSSKWSELNKHLVAKLVKEGRMTGAGLAKVDFILPEAGGSWPKRPGLPLPDWLKAGLMVSPKAWESFNSLPPSHRRDYIAWISDAKKEETRQRRIREAIDRLEKNERLGMK